MITIKELSTTKQENKEGKLRGEKKGEGGAGRRQAEVRRQVIKTNRKVTQVREDCW